MNRTKKILCAVSALLLAGSLMTGCLGQSSQADDPESVALLEETAASSDTDAGAEADAEETDAPKDQKDDSSAAEDEPVELSDKEIKAAQKVLENFFDACIKNDKDGMMKYSNVRDAMMLWDGEEYSEDEIKDLLDDLSDSLESYQIIEGESKAQDLVKFNESITDILKDAEEELANLEADASAAADNQDNDDPEEYRRQIEMVKEILKPIDGLAVFKVTIVSKPDEDDEDAEPETSDENIYVMRVDGKWIVDIMLADLMIDTDDEPDYSVTSANVSAKNTFNAANTALTDMDCIDFRVSELDGNYVFTGEEFAEAETVKTENKQDVKGEELQQEMIATMRMYFGDISDLAQVAIWIEKGVCMAVAVETEDGTFGSYPLSPAQDEDADEPESLTAALEAAKKVAVG